MSKALQLLLLISSVPYKCAPASRERTYAEISFFLSELALSLVDKAVAAFAAISPADPCALSAEIGHCQPETDCILHCQ